jgi:hypothetical protein
MSGGHYNADCQDDEAFMSQLGRCRRPVQTEWAGYAVPVVNTEVPTTAVDAYEIICALQAKLSEAKEAHRALLDYRTDLADRLARAEQAVLYVYACGPDVSLTRIKMDVNRISRIPIQGCPGSES